MKKLFTLGVTVAAVLFLASTFTSNVSNAGTVVETVAETAPPDPNWIISPM